MVDVKWIKIFIDIFNNRKIRMIESMSNGDAIIVIWFKLLCLAGEINEGGLVTFDKQTPYTNQMLAIQFGKKVDVITEALNLFVKFKMIDIEDGFIWILNWEKYQSLDKIEHQKKLAYDRVKRYRERQKIASKSNDKNGCNVSETIQITESNAIELDKEEDIDKEYINSSSKNNIPTLNDVKNFFEEEELKVNYKSFYNHYSKNGWKVGTDAINDWKAIARIWNDNYLKAKSKNIDIKLEDWQIQGMNDVMEEFKDEGQNTNSIGSNDGPIQKED